MRYRLGILGGLVIMGIVALGLASGVVGSGTVEAARPAVRVTTHELMVAGAATEGECTLVLNIGWEGSAYAHKNGLARIFLYDPAGVLIRYVDVPVVKSRYGGSFGYYWGQGDPGEYRSRVVLYTSRGKDGLTIGNMLDLNQRLFTC